MKENFITSMDQIPKGMMWIDICSRLPLGEEFMIQNLKKLNKEAISIHQQLSETFMTNYPDYVDWQNIAIYQRLNEDFIRQNVERFDTAQAWPFLCGHQPLSEAFLFQYASKLDWNAVSMRQNLTERFIEHYADRVNWWLISQYQKLSIPFIERHIKDLNMVCVCKYQELDEAFIERNLNDICWFAVARHQHLSPEFRAKHYVVDFEPALYYDAETKKREVESCGRYECYEEYFIAYKGIRRDNYSKFKFQDLYLPGQTYRAHADHTDDEHSFGLSVWTQDHAQNYCNEKLIKVKILYEDVARVIHSDKDMIRCSAFTVLEEVS